MRANVLHTVNSCLENPWPEASAAYSSLHEHVSDLNARLDLLIRRETLRHVQEEDAEQLSYVAVTSREVMTLLDHPLLENDRSGDPAEAKALDGILAKLERRIREREKATLASSGRLPWLELLSKFHLSETEADVLLACFAVALDRKYERVYGYLHGDISRRQPTIGCLLAICCPRVADRVAARRVFWPSATLFSSRLLHLVDDEPQRVPFSLRTVCIDERIASFLDGDSGFDVRIRDCLDLAAEASVERAISVQPSPVVEQLLGSVRAYGTCQKWPVAPTIYLHGPPAAGKVRIAQQVSRALDCPLMLVDAERVAASPLGFQGALPLIFREGLLLGACLYLDKIESALEQDPAGLRLRSLLECLDAHRGPPSLLIGERPWRWGLPAQRSPWLPIRLDRPGHAEQIATWQLAMTARVGFSDRDASWLASIHPLPAERAMAAIRIAEAAAVMQGKHQATVNDVVRASRDLSQPNFAQLARKIEGPQNWDDLVLPVTSLQQLHDICVQAKYRCHVYGTWGFDERLPLGKGLNVLFAGPSGTGKTMSAQVIANDLGIDLYKIDLSQVVSKYIGETEKNLHQIFATAQAANVILFFDEADALLAKRSDVKDAHDRYANLEVAYLLQKMEEYEGITILATNLRRNIDDAFARRIRFIVEFPAPSESERIQIWNRIWPKELPLARDVEFARLARFKLNGGSIRNVAVCAAFLAAEANEPVAMCHLTMAIKRELQKMGRLLDDENCEGQGTP